MKLNYFKMESDAYAPLRATDRSAGFDLSAYLINRGVPYDVGLYPGEKFTFRTALKFEIPDGHMMMIASRSGLGAGKGLVVINQPGIIDSDYRGEVKVTLHHTKCDTRDDELQPALRIHHGMRIAQGIIVPVPAVQLNEVEYENQLTTTARGTGGHGSTGV